MLDVEQSSFFLLCCAFALALALALDLLLLLGIPYLGQSQPGLLHLPITLPAGG